VAAAGLGVCEWRRASGWLTVSAKAREICGFPAKGRVTFQMATAILHRGDRSRVSKQIRAALDGTKRSDNALEFRIVTPAGEQRLIALNGQPVFEKVEGPCRAMRYIGVLRDITAERAAQISRDRSMVRLRLALGAGHVAVWQSDQVSGEVYGPEFNEILGFPGDRVLTAEDVRSRYLPGELERIRRLTHEIFARGERQAEVEARVRRLDGEERWLLLRGELTANADGEARGFVGVAMDITERKHAEERIKFLAREVDHRANNLLALVQGFLRLSKASTVEALRRVLLGRITALGRAHQLLSEARWQGAHLKRLVEEELLAFTLGDAARISIRGADVALSAAAAQSMAMALHELATNAAKYGALSAPSGRLDVSWSREGSGSLTVRWVESGGPPVTPPTRQGLGGAMLARALDGLKGRTWLDWRPAGLLCEMTLPPESVETTLG
jgi:PAS domain S-box-containing protein